MKEREAMSINCEHLIGVQAGNLNCTIGKNLRHNKRIYPPRTKLTKNELEAGVVEEEFLAKGELLPRNHSIVECLCLFLVDSRAFIGFHAKFL